MPRTSRLPLAPGFRTKDLLGAISSSSKDESVRNDVLEKDTSSNDNSSRGVEGQFDDDDIMAVESVVEEEEEEEEEEQEQEQEDGLEEDKGACISSLDFLLRAADMVETSPPTTTTNAFFGEEKITLENLYFWRQQYLEDSESSSSDDDDDDDGDGEQQDEDDASSFQGGEDCYGSGEYNNRETILFIQDNSVKYTILQAVANDSDADDDDDEEDDAEDGYARAVSPSSSDTAKNESYRKSFEDRYKELQKYYKKHGHANVPSTKNSETGDLGRFLANQRSKFRLGHLDPSRPFLYRALKITGFDEKKNSKSSTVKKKTTARGRLSKPSPKLKDSTTNTKSTSSEKKLGRPSKSLSTSGKVLTDSTNKRHGRGRPPKYYTPEDPSPSKKKKTTPTSKIEEASNAKKRGSPSSDDSNSSSSSKKTKKMKPSDTSKRGQTKAWFTWEERMTQLQEFKDREGHVHPPVSKTGPDGELGQWLSSKRSQHKKGVVKPEHLKDLRRFGCKGFGK